jgi:hypothetical protein
MKSLLQLPKNIRPQNALSVVIASLAIVPLLGHFMTQLSNDVQVFFGIYLIFYTSLVMGGFYYVLIWRPANFYPPSGRKNEDFAAEGLKEHAKRTNGISEKPMIEKDALCTKLQASLGEQLKTVTLTTKKLSDATISTECATQLESQPHENTHTKPKKQLKENIGTKDVSRKFARRMKGGPSAVESTRL